MMVLTTRMKEMRTMMKTMTKKTMAAMMRMMMIYQVRVPSAAPGKPWRGILLKVKFTEFKLLTFWVSR